LDGSIRILDPTTGAERGKLTSGRVPAAVLAVAPDGRTLASVAPKRVENKLEWEIWVWDLATRQPKGPAHTVAGDGIALGYTPQGRLWVATQQEGAVAAVKEMP